MTQDNDGHHLMIDFSTCNRRTFANIMNWYIREHGKPNSLHMGNGKAVDEVVEFAHARGISTVIHLDPFVPCTRGNPNCYLLIGKQDEIARRAEYLKKFIKVYRVVSILYGGG